MTHSFYETSNPYLATYLVCCEGRLVSFRRVSKRRFLFRFASDVRLHQLLRLWWSGTPVPMVPTRIFASLQRLRSLVRGSALHATHNAAPAATPAQAASTPQP